MSWNTFLPSATKLRRLCFYTCLSFCPQGGGVCLSAWWDTLLGPGTPPEQPPPHPWDQAPPTRTRHHPPGTRHRPLGAGTPPDQAPPPPGAETATAVDGTHPTGRHSFGFGIFEIRRNFGNWKKFVNVYNQAFNQLTNQTRKHSSKMCTVRLPTIHASVATKCH